MTPDDPRHGTPAGATAHRRAGQKACTHCLEAHRRANIIRQLRPSKRPALGPRRRIQALQAIGHSRAVIARELGYADYGALTYIMRDTTKTILATTAARIEAVYDRLSMTAPTGPAAQRTRTWAKRHGYAPPLAWDDIDDPNERPHTGTDRWAHTRDADVDPVVVTRILAGDWRLPCTAAEKAAVVAAWDGSHYRLAQLTGWKVERYTERSEDVA